LGLDPKAFWQVARATRMSVIVDADAYFTNARLAMLKAKRRIMLIGWDFDARIQLAAGDRLEGEPAPVGDFIHWLVDRNPELEVYLLRWDVGALKTLLRGTNIATFLRWMRHPRIHLRLDSFHPTGGSHHQKIVVIDDCLAFCGGIDMTSERWDTREHHDDQPRRVTPHGSRYGPWHDATTALQGPIAAALGELARERWERAGGDPIEPVPDTNDCWPAGLKPDFRDLAVGIARTRPEMPECPEIREIESLFVSQIKAARTSIYAESQYFASRKIAEAIAASLAKKRGPEIVIVNPLTAQGWLEPLAMDTARARLFTALKQRDPHDRLRMYHPFTAQGEAIYVHAKIMIVDGRTLRIGSGNMNNRSMGLDTECDVAIAPSGGDAASVRAIQDGLVAEHLGVSARRVANQIGKHGSLIAAIDALRTTGRSLRPYEVPDLSGVEEWLANNEVLDPESPSEMFESTTKRGLFRRFRHP
jgi:phosphatidylserine/phosphatidylglycerophosphate/cardiolipin synthase-like enzyme